MGNLQERTPLTALEFEPEVTARIASSGRCIHYAIRIFHPINGSYLL